MTAPIVIGPPPEPFPQRGDGDTYADRMDLRIAWENLDLYPNMNASVAQVNANAIIAANGAAAATVALAATNFKGLYSALTGAQPTGISCFHLGAFWILSADVADVTTKVPGTASEWKEAKTINALPYFKATGAVTAGTPVSILADGSVAFPAITNAALGTPVDANASAYYTQVEYDAVNNKLVAVYNDGSNVAIRSATFVSGVWTWQIQYTITTGTSYANHKLIGCGSTGKMAVMWVGQSAPYKRYVNVFDCSGTTPVTSGSVEWYATQTGNFGFVFDEVSAQICMSIYQNADAVIKVGVATLSGNSTVTPTWSTISGLTGGTPAPHLLAVDGKLVCSSTNAANAAIISYVGTVSGATVTFSTPVTLSVTYTSGSGYYLSYDSYAQKILLLISNSGSPLRVAIGTLKGGAITFDSVAYQIQSAGARNIWMAYDSVAKGTTVIFEDTGNSNYVSTVTLKFLSGELTQSAKAVVNSADGGGATVSVTCSNSGDNFFSYAQKKVVHYKNYSSTAPSYIGIAQDTVLNNEFTRVAISQYMTENMAGLSLSSKYYVADNGSLTTTQTATFAGTAVGSTRLIVKG